LPRIPYEHQVPGDRRTLQPGVGPQLLHPQYGDLPVHLALDLLQSGQLIQLSQQLLDRALRHFFHRLFSYSS
jgi:hypothetical protein